VPNGEEYVRCWCNRIAEIRIEGAITGIENVAAGSYSFVVSEKDGSTTSYPITVIEGGVIELEIR
jgi:hypothetical protein